MKILTVEFVLIDKLKEVIKANNDGGLVLKEFMQISVGSVFAVDDDSRSNFSGVSLSSSTSSIFQPPQIL